MARISAGARSRSTKLVLSRSDLAAIQIVVAVATGAEVAEAVADDATTGNSVADVTNFRYPTPPHGESLAGVYDVPMLRFGMYALGWGIAIYAIMYLLWSGLVIYGLAAGVLSLVVRLVALAGVTMIAARSLHLPNWKDLVPYTISWAVAAVVLDALFLVPFSGWSLYATWSVWVGYALVAILPILPILPTLASFKRSQHAAPSGLPDCVCKRGRTPGYFLRIVFYSASRSRPGNVFAWVIVFRMFFIATDTVEMALAGTAALYVLSQVVTFILTPLTGMALRRGVRRALILGTLAAVGSYGFFATVFLAQPDDRVFWIIATFAVTIGIHRALYWIPYKAAEAESRRTLAARVSARSDGSARPGGSGIYACNARKRPPRAFFKCISPDAGLGTRCGTNPGEI